MTQFTPLHVGMMGEMDINGEKTDAIVLVGDKAAIASWARAGVLGKHILPSFTRVPLTYDQRHTALDAMFRSLDVKDGQVVDRTTQCSAELSRAVRRRHVHELNHEKLIIAVRSQRGLIIGWHCTDKGVGMLLAWREAKREAEERVAPPPDDPGEPPPKPMKATSKRVTFRGRSSAWPPEAP